MSILDDLGIGRRTLIMGVLNVTPDSFSDGGRFASADEAVTEAVTLIDDGADIIDIGGESTRPATFRDDSPLDPSVEMNRVLPVVEGLLRCRPDACISIDTYKPEVAAAAMQAGARILNDVSGLACGPGMAQLAGSTGSPLVLMHMPGLPRRMPAQPVYGDVVADVVDYFRERIALALAEGVDASQIVVDPGLGFGKTAAQSLELLRRIDEIVALGYPVLSGPSRKSFLGAALGGDPPGERLEGTAAAVAWSIAGGAQIVRVHDVRFMSRLARVCDAIAARDGNVPR